MKLIIVLCSTLAAVLLLPSSSCDSDDPHTYYERIDIDAPVAWYPVVADIVVRFYTHVTHNLIKVYQIVQYRMERQKELLLQFPDFYGSISMFYDGDHLRSFTASSSSFEQTRNANFTVPKPKMAHDVVDTVKALMNNLKKHAKN